MRKLTLDPDTLHVESFAADEISPPARGTVHGQSYHDEPDPGTGGSGGWSTYWSCPTKDTCIGPTYCCPETWHTCYTCDTWCPGCSGA